MANPLRADDAVIKNTITCGTLRTDTGGIPATAIDPNPTAGSEIPVTSQRNLVVVHERMNKAFDASIGTTTEEHGLYFAPQASTLRRFRAIIDDLGSAGTCTIKLKKNGTQIGSSIVFDATTDTDRTAKDITFTTSEAAVAAYDMFGVERYVASSLARS